MIPSSYFLLLFITSSLFLMNASAATLATCPRQCICHEHSIACSCDGAENPELIIASLGSSYITSLIVHSCEKVTILNGSFAGVVLVERLSFIGIAKLHFETSAFQDILQSPKQFVIDECEIPTISPNAFTGLSNIDHFWFRNSKIGEIMPEAFHKLTNLEYIYFHKTKIERIRRRGFSKMYQIRNLYFKQAIEIDNVEGFAFSDSQIDEIILDDTEIANTNPSFLKNIYSRTLKIENSSIFLENSPEIEDPREKSINNVENCAISRAKMNFIDFSSFGCLKIEIDSSKISRIAGRNDSVQIHVEKIEFSNSTIDVLDQFAFSNLSLNTMIFEKVRISRISSLGFQKSKINELIFENSIIGAMESSAFKKSNIQKIEFQSMDISEIEAEAFDSMWISKMNFENSKIDRISNNIMKNVRIGELRIDGSRIHKLDDLAFFGENLIDTFTLTASDLSTPTSTSPKLLSPSHPPIHVTIANNTIDCHVAANCNAFLLNPPQHKPLLWQIANNKCRPPARNLCLETNSKAHEEFPKGSFEGKIRNLTIFGSFLEESRRIFELTTMLRLENSMIFEAAANLGNLASAEFLNNTILECCSGYTPDLSPEMPDSRCDMYFYGVKCYGEENFESLPMVDLENDSSGSNYGIFGNTDFKRCSAFTPDEVHKPINEAVAEGLILDPKNVKYVKNIDRKQNPLEQRLEIDLNHISGEKEEEAPLFSTGRVRIRESKCKLYETCDVKTADEADENSLKTCRA
ncbi:unnamed protein product [Caenorhabditis angaria]|uniref:Receptor L-domain domain-containing protein n=1 Tax=Caenorhabditis angaria TaxID=860376 RepID=A0A9P1IGI4_9PELO|nr:unnamed protein product [Caenorhabditis angaria]